MPKAAKNPRARLHNKAVALAKAERKSQEDATASSSSATSNPQPSAQNGGEVKGQPLTAVALEKRRQAALIAKAERDTLPTPSTAPYSKSHLRRLKRKTRENLSGGNLSSIESALDGVLPPASSVPTKSKASGAKSAMDLDDDVGVHPPADAKQPADNAFPKIGQGKGKPLKEKQKRKELLESTARLQAVMKNPAFKSNPFAAIRIHATNTLLMGDKNAS